MRKKIFYSKFTLSKNRKKNNINLGIEYGFGRVPIASCDFSTHVYSYCDTENDFALKNFSLSYEDFNFKVHFW